MTEAYIVDAIRTPRRIGKSGKDALSQPQQHLAAILLKLRRVRQAGWRPPSSRLSETGLLLDSRQRGRVLICTDADGMGARAPWR